jgi:SAM-dependent methyltransferase
MPDQSAREAERAASAAVFGGADVARCYACRPPYAPALYEFLLAKTKGRNRALDLGCGPGKIAIILADHFAEVTALDPSVAMIRAGRRADKGRHGNLVWVNQSAEDIGTGEGFDLVTAGTAIHWMRHDLLFPKLAALTPTLAVISGDEPEHPPCGREAWIEFKVRWLTRLGRIYDQPGREAEGHRHEPWLDIAGRERFTFTFRQSVGDFVVCQHSRAAWTRVEMGETLADEFDRDLEALMRPHVRDGMLELELVSELVWGAPRTSLR